MARNEAWVELSLEEQLKSLDDRRGNSTRQRAMILARTKPDSE